MYRNIHTLLYRFKIRKQTSLFSDGRQICLFTKRPILHQDFTQSSLQEAINELQQLLHEQSLLSNCSGRFDAETEEAVKEFQKQNHLNIDGIVGPLTWACLYYPKLSRHGYEEKCPTLAKAVKTMQSILRDEEFLTKDPDGRFDRQTEKAIRKFQQVYGLKNDGIVGAATWAVLLGMRQKINGGAPSAIYLSTDQSWILGEQLLIVSFILLGIYHSPLPGSPPMFTTALATAYGLTYVVPLLLDRLPIRQNNHVSRTLLQYAPYVLTGIFWKPIFNILSASIK